MTAREQFPNLLILNDFQFFINYILMRTRGV